MTTQPPWWLKYSQPTAPSTPTPWWARYTRPQQTGSSPPPTNRLRWLFSEPVTVRNPNAGLRMRPGAPPEPDTITYRNRLTYFLNQGLPAFGAEAIGPLGPTMIAGGAGEKALEAALSRASMAARAALAARRGIPTKVPIPTPAAEAVAPAARPIIRQTVVPGITMRPAVAPQIPPAGVGLKPVQLAPGVEAEAVTGLGGQARRIVRTAIRQATPPLPPGTEPVGSVPFKAAKFGEQAGNVIEQTRPIITEAERAQRRGVLSDAAVDDLARMIGVSKNDLLRAAPGTTYNAENISAARQILKESADEVYAAAEAFVKNPKSAEAQGKFVDLLTQHGQVQVRVAGLASEAGRSLRQFRRILQDLPTVGADIDRAIAALPSDIRAAATRVVRAGKGKAPQVLGELRQPTWKDMLVEFSTAAKISGPVTQLRNVAGNTVAALLRPVERGVTGAAEAARALVTRTPRERFIGEAGADLFGRAAALKDASRNFLRALASETPMLRETARIGEVGRVGAIPGRTGSIVRIPFRFLTAFDEFFREVNRRGNVYAEAYRLAAKEGTPVARLGERIAHWAQNLPKDVAERVSQETAEYLFQKELTDFGRWAIAGRNKFALGRILFPFFRTPMNLLRFVAERSPLGPVMPRNIAAFRAGGAQASEALARVAVGSMVTAGVALRAKEGLITGAGPTDPRQRDLLYAQGWQPYSVKIGDRWISYRGFDPVASYLSNVASAVETLRTEKDWNTAAPRLAKEFTRNIQNSTWLYGLQQITDAMDDPERYGEQFVGGLVSGMIPRALDPIQKALDPFLRETRTLSAQTQGRIPGLSQRLPARLDVLGRPIQPEGGPLRGLFPSISTPRPDPVLAELSRLEVNIPMPPRTVRWDGKTVPAEEDERRRAQLARGRLVQEQLRGLIASPQYQRLDDEDKRDVLKRWMLRIARAVPVRGK